MYYCRFSTDFYRCDVSVREVVADDGEHIIPLGLAIDTASFRVVPSDQFPLPDPVEPDDAAVHDPELLANLCERLAEALEHAHREPIEHELSAASWEFGEESEAVDLLLDLRKAGFRFPRHVLPAVNRRYRLAGIAVPYTHKIEDSRYCICPWSWVDVLEWLDELERVEWTEEDMLFSVEPVGIASAKIYTDEQAAIGYDRPDHVFLSPRGEVVMLWGDASKPDAFTQIGKIRIVRGSKDAEGF